jgi:hypothetical protein
MRLFLLAGDAGRRSPAKNALALRYKFEAICGALLTAL